MKELMSRISSHKDKIVAHQREGSYHNREIKRLTHEKKNMENTLKQLKRDSNELYITDHAIVRYLARIEGVDIEAIKGKMLTDHFSRAYEALGTNGEYPTGDGYNLVIREQNVVTIKN